MKIAITHAQDKEIAKRKVKRLEKWMKENDHTHPYYVDNLKSLHHFRDKLK